MGASPPTLALTLAMVLRWRWSPPNREGLALVLWRRTPLTQLGLGVGRSLRILLRRGAGQLYCVMSFCVVVRCTSCFARCYVCLRLAKPNGTGRRVEFVVRRLVSGLHYVQDWRRESSEGLVCQSGVVKFEALS